MTCYRVPMSFETKGQELLAKFISSVVVFAMYTAGALAFMYLIDWLGPNLREPVVCVCDGIEK